MPTCLSLVSSREPEQLSLAMRNHGTYCSQYGYTHSSEDISHLGHRGLWGLYMLHAASRALRGIPQGDLLMVLTAESAVFRPVALETLMEAHSVLLSFEKQQPDYDPKPQMNWLVLRNDAQARERLDVAVFEAHKKALHAPHRVEGTIYRNLGALDYYAQIAGFHLNINWTSDSMGWFNANIFIVNSLPPPLRGMDNAWHKNHLLDVRLGHLVLKEVDAALRGATPMTHPHPAPGPLDRYTVYNPQARIALVTLYTHHIASYALIAERNIKRYCDRHGLAYHVYRAIPDDLDSTVNATWHKAWLLDRHFDQHDWVIWIDADILFLNMEKKIEDLLQDRDLLLAKDIGGSEFNAGVMGLRCTPENRKVLDHIRARIDAVTDKSSVYVSGGDQTQSILALIDLGRLKPGVVLDCLSINTAPLFRSPSTLMVHYMGLPDLYRVLYMAHDDAKTQEH